jgi:2-hydroxycyclohexanecarboxyl-CoA dehydrogenase
VLQQLREDSALGSRLLDGMVRATPLKRVAQPREVAAVFAFLASEAGSFVTGQALSVSGGLTMV